MMSEAGGSLRHFLDLPMLMYASPAELTASDLTVTPPPDIEDEQDEEGGTDFSMKLIPLYSAYMITPIVNMIAGRSAFECLKVDLAWDEFYRHLSFVYHCALVMCILDCDNNCKCSLIFVARGAG